MALFQDVKYICVDTKEELNKMINGLKITKLCTIDLETSGLSVIDDYIVGIGLSWQEKTGFYIPLNHDYGQNLDYEETLEILKPYLESDSIDFAAHGRKFDQTMLGASYLEDDFIKNNPNFVTDLWLTAYHKEMGIKYQPTIFKKLGISCFIKYDTMAFAYLTGKYANIGNGNSTASLKKITEAELGIKMVQIEALFGMDPTKRASGKKAKAKKASRIRFETLDPRQEIPLPGGDIVQPYQYGCADCDMTLRLFHKFYNQVKDKFLFKVDHGITPMTKLMELNGVKCNIEEMNRQYKFLNSERTKLQSLIYKIVSDQVGTQVQFDIGSAVQVGKILFDKLGYPVQERSAKTGKPLTNATVLEAMEKDYPLVKNILNWRSLRKLAEDFFMAMQTYINQTTQRIHTSYATYHVISGRYASEDPNMQNQPKKTTWSIYNPYDGDYEVSCNVRQCYIPPSKDFYILEGDYSQVEYRVFAGRSQSRALIEGYKQGLDMHTKNASMIFGVPEEQISKKLRNDGKAFSFGIMFGMREAGISLRTGIPRSQCKIYVQNYFQAIPEGVRHINDITLKAKQDCCVTTHFGRVAHIPEFKSDNHKLRFKAEREAFNITIQGCISCDNKIVTLEDGFISIGDLFTNIDWGKMPVGTAKNVTVWNGVKYVKSQVVYAGMKAQVKIYFNDGSTMVTSPEHKFLREDTYGGLHWREAKDLIGSKTTNPDAIKITKPVCSINDYNEYQVYFGRRGLSKAHNSNQYDANDIFRSLEPFDAGVLLGRLAADGSIGIRSDSGSLVWYIAEHEKNILPYMEGLLKDIGWKYSKEIKDRSDTGREDMHRLIVYSKTLATQLDKTGVKRKIPKQITCNVEILRGYLRGFIDGDGGVSGNQVQVTFGAGIDQSYKKDWAREMQTAIRFFGMRCSIGFYEYANRLRIHKGYNDVFLSEIGFINDKKTKKLMAVIPNGRKVRHCQRVNRIEVIMDKRPMFDVVNCPDSQFSVNGLITHNTAADILRIGLVRLGKLLVQNYGPRFNDIIKPILTTHDSIALCVHRSVDINKLMALMAKACEIPIKSFPHIKMDFQIGPSYGQIVDWGEGVEKYFDTKKADFGFGDFFANIASKNTSDKKSIDTSNSNLNPIQSSGNDLSFKEDGSIENPPTYKENVSINDFMESQNQDPIVLRVSVIGEFKPEQAVAIKQLVTKYPGKNRVILELSEGEIPIGATTSLNQNDESKFKMICNCSLHIDKKSISNKALTNNIKF